MSRHQMLLAAAVAAAATVGACGSDDKPAAKSGRTADAAAPAASSTPYDGTYELTLSPAAARNIPDPSIRAGLYRLTLEQGRYKLVSPQHGPYNRGTVRANGDALQFGRDEGEQCAATARYEVARASGGLLLRAVSDGCEGRKAFFDGRTWRRG